MRVAHAVTLAQVEQARERLVQQEQNVEVLDHRIADAYRALEELIADSKLAISLLEEERRRARIDVKSTKEYLSPIKRLPEDILKHIFVSMFEDSASAAWTISSVCLTWRKLALNMPSLWSKIRLVTTSNSSPEFVRLWLERSGTKIPLDIEIYVHAHSGLLKHKKPDSAGHILPVMTPVTPVTPAAAYAMAQAPVAQPQEPTLVLGAQTAIPSMVQNAFPQMHAHIDPVLQLQELRNGRRKMNSLPSASWGHIALFYLADQMHRWKRFIFRFDRQFESVSALRNISRDAPLLEEFEISSGEPLRNDADISFQDWAMWLPLTEREINVPKLHSVTLQYVPFRWSSPLIASNLRTLSLRSSASVSIGAYTTANMTLDRLLHIISSNPSLEHLSLNFPNSQHSVLPLETTRLNHLKKLCIIGNYTMQPLIDALVLPALEYLALDTGRESFEEAAGNLITRSNNPPISYLSVSYNGSPYSPSYFHDTPPGATPWGFLSGMDQLRTLKVGHVALEFILEELSRVNEGSNSWLAPRLEHLALKNCAGHGDSVSKLVVLVEARNPRLPGADGTLPQYVPGTGASATANNGFVLPIILEDGGDGTPPPPPHPPLIQPARLKSIEMENCTLIGEDIVKWLKSRVEEIDIKEPIQPRFQSRSPFYASDDGWP